jgi:hypothetical protein
VDGRCELPSQRYYAAMFSNTGGQVGSQNIWIKKDEASCRLHRMLPTCRIVFIAASFIDTPPPTGEEYDNLTH